MLCEREKFKKEAVNGNSVAFKINMKEQSKWTTTPTPNTAVRVHDYLVICLHLPLLFGCNQKWCLG